MVDLLTDVHRSEGLLELQSNNSALANDENYKQQVMAAVLVKHGVTRAQYDSSLVWYGQNLAELVRVYNKVQKNLYAEIDYWTEEDRLSRIEFEVSEAGDTVNVWTIHPYHILSEKRAASFHAWEISPDSNYVAGDSLVWKFHVPQVPEAHLLVASFSLNYERPDTVFTEPIAQTTVIRRDTTVCLSCASESDKMFQSMIASIYLLKDSLKVPDCYAFIDSLSLIRIHR